MAGSVEPNPDEAMRAFQKVQRAMYDADPRMAAFVEEVWVATINSDRVRPSRPAAGYIIRDMGLKPRE